MRAVSRIGPLAVLLGFALFSAGCGSNNKGKIEGRWKYVSFSEKTGADGREHLEKLSKESAYSYLEFQPDGTLIASIDGTDPAKLEALKALAAKEKRPFAASAKYKLLAGDGVEI